MNLLEGQDWLKRGQDGFARSRINYCHCQTMDVTVGQEVLFMEFDPTI